MKGGRTALAASLRRWATAVALFLCAGFAGLQSHGATPPSRPNILWLTWEDAGPHLGCYGDSYASTPNLDALSARGMRFRRVWSTAPVCAPARTAIISGMYPSSTGAEHMRSDVPLPEGTRMFPQYLRDEGYYCSNNSKEDYNLRKPPGVWDESSPRAHWRNRAAGQPFFAVFNFTETHESQVRRRPHTFVHDPATAPIPPYMPDTRETREAWAQYHDQVSVVDRRVGAALKEVEEAGLAEDTIVFAFGDHGAGLPRNKRSACDSGLRVPLIAYFPPRWRHLAPKDYAEGGESPRLVNFVDLAPTMLSIARIRPPSWMQGMAFAGWYVSPAPEFTFGHRGRMDERIDLVRAVTDGRFVYVRNYFPHLPHGQHVAYLFQTPATIAWKRLHDSGELDAAQRAYWEPKAPEELYDLESDPHEVRNLAAEPGRQALLERFRTAHRRHTLAVRDVGLLPEAEMHARAGANAPGDLARTLERYDVNRVFEAAEVAARRDLADLPALIEMTRSDDSAVRYWAAMGFLIRGARAVQAQAETLRSLLSDASPSVRVAAGEALARHGGEADANAGLETLLAAADLNQSSYLAALAALNALDHVADRLGERRERLGALPRSDAKVATRMNDYVERLLTHLIGPQASQ
jgi:arylsulfatase A-like enzyme